MDWNSSCIHNGLHLLVSNLQDNICYHCHWFLWRTGTDFLYLCPIQFTKCHSLKTLFLLFSSNIPNTFQTFQSVDRIFRRIYRQWRNWQWDIVRDVQQSSPRPGASKSLPAAAAVSISWILPVFPIHTTLRPLISPSVSFRAPRGRHGSAKTSIYTLSWGCSHTTTNTHGTSLKRTRLRSPTRMYTKISSSQHPVVSAIRNIPAWLIKYCQSRFKRERFTQHTNMTYLTSELTEGNQEANPAAHCDQM